MGGEASSMKRAFLLDECPSDSSEAQRAVSPLPPSHFVPFIKAWLICRILTFQRF